VLDTAHHLSSTTAADESSRLTAQGAWRHVANRRPRGPGEVLCTHHVADAFLVLTMPDGWANRQVHVGMGCPKGRVTGTGQQRIASPHRIAAPHRSAASALLENRMRNRARGRWARAIGACSRLGRIARIRLCPRRTFSVSACRAQLSDV
jgi:hypothetical protein